MDGRFGIKSAIWYELFFLPLKLSCVTLNMLVISAKGVNSHSAAGSVSKHCSWTACVKNQSALLLWRRYFTTSRFPPAMLLPVMAEERKCLICPHLCAFHVITDSTFAFQHIWDSKCKTMTRVRRVNRGVCVSSACVKWFKSEITNKEVFCCQIMGLENVVFVWSFLKTLLPENMILGTMMRSISYVF